MFIDVYRNLAHGCKLKVPKVSGGSVWPGNKYSLSAHNLWVGNIRTHNDGQKSKMATTNMTIFSGYFFFLATNIIMKLQYIKIFEYLEEFKTAVAMMANHSGGGSFLNIIRQYTLH